VVIYEDHAYCYGGCGVIPLSELDSGGVPIGAAVPRPAPVNLEADLEHIKALPKARVRGLDLPVDRDSYYIVWPGDGYYKRRRFIADGGSKYYCPRGHKKPLYIPWVQPKAETLAVVEGELNALSLATLKPSFSVCSPGGSGDFGEKLLKTDASFLLTFKHFLVIVDRDEAGLKAATALKKALLHLTPYISIILMPRDANDLLVAGQLSQEVACWLNKNGCVHTAVTKPST
jgi:hypothetical protein